MGENQTQDLTRFGQFLPTSSGQGREISLLIW